MRLLLRFLALASLSVWIGGFTVYGGAVIPILHRQIGVAETSAVTRQVTDVLNALGGVTVVVWSVLLWSEKRLVHSRWGSLRLGAFSFSVSCLIALVLLHEIMDAQLDSGTMSGFYRLHRAYLLTSTIGWAANLGLIGTSLRVWSPNREEPRV